LLADTTAGLNPLTAVGPAEVPEVNADPEERARRMLREIYSAEVGVREKSNRNDGERIGQYLGYTGLGEGYAWCAAFVSWCFKEVGRDTPRTAWSPSLFPSKRIIWRKGDRLPTVGAQPQKGDVFAIWYPNLKRIGHAGFVDDWGDSMVITVEGNTSEGGKQEGVFRKRRPTNSIYAVADWL
jgi:hypothetical protein